MSNKLVIKKSDRVVITKVKPWAICFKVNDQSYLLHGSAELGEPDIQTLYRRDLSKNGNYKLTLIKRINGDDRVDLDYIPRQKGSTLVYKNIDSRVFVFRLCYNELCSGYLQKAVDETRSLVKATHELISREEDTLGALRQHAARLKKGEFLNVLSIL